MKKRILIAIPCIFALCFVMRAKADCNFNSTYTDSHGNTRVTYDCTSSKGMDYTVDVNWLTAVVYYGYLGL